MKAAYGFTLQRNNMVYLVTLARGLGKLRRLGIESGNSLVISPCD